MNEKENEFDIEDIFEVYNGLDETDPKVKLVMIGQFFNNLNQGGIKYDEILDSFKKLEEIVGEIPVFAVSEALPEEEKNQRYEYLIFELLYTAFSSFRYLAAYARHGLPKIESEMPIISNLKSLFRNRSNENLVTRYCREWDIQYNNLINPIFKQLKEKKLLPKGFQYKGRQSEIDAVFKFTSKNKDLDIFDFLTSPLDAFLRNSLVHYNYYFVKEGEELVYYNIYKGKLDLRRISTKDFELNVIHLLIHRNISTVRIAKKLAVEMGIEWIRRDFNKIP